MALLQVGYWNIRGLAAPLRMMLCYRDVRFENKAYCLNEEFDRSVWLVDAKPAIKEKNPLANLPYIMDGDIVVCQSNACLSYLGRKLNLWGLNEKEIIDCEQLLCEAMDLRNSVVGFCYGRTGNPADPQESNAFIESAQQGILAKFELWLAKQLPQFGSDAPFFVGGHPTAPDFHIFELLDQLNLLAACRSLPGVTECIHLPNLKMFYDSFRRIPANEKYFSSAMSRAPCNNLSAVFGSTTDGSQWQKGSPLPHDVSGIY